MRRRQKFGFKERFQGLEQVIWGIKLNIRGKKIFAHDDVQKSFGGEKANY